MAKPINVDPSQSWDGDDGFWSTFAIRVGTPEQVVKVLPSTTVPETWVVLGEGCTNADQKTCPDDRGGIYDFNKSSTWERKNFFRLGVELNLDYDIQNNGEYGFETLSLGYEGSGGPTLKDQVIAGIATKEFYLGSLGLTPRPINFTAEDQHPSLLSTLRSQNLIPSLSFGYSAGAYYRLKKVEGSLVFGGYDATRFTPNEAEFNFASDISRDLVVGLRSIKYSDSKTANGVLLSEGILTFIDSTVPHIWLPVDVCQAFENAFGLTYDKASGLYPVDDTLHESLLAQNASITFTLGDEVNGGKTVDVILPYLSFDQQAKSPFLSNFTRYFPLRRAANDTQFTLGRTFLQESYLIVDYERSNFSVSQAIFPENAAQNLVPIVSINDTSHNINITTKYPPSGVSRKLSSGVIVSIAIAAVILCILIFATTVFIIRRRRQEAEQLKSQETQDPTIKPELPGLSKPVVGELDNPHVRYKTDVEMEGSESNPALNAKSRLAEMEASKGGIEMETGHVAAAELDAAATTSYELAGSDTASSRLPSPSARSPSRLPSPTFADKQLPPLKSTNPLSHSNLNQSPLPRSDIKPEKAASSNLGLEHQPILNSPSDPLHSALEEKPVQEPSLSGGEQESGSGRRTRWGWRKRRSVE